MTFTGFTSSLRYLVLLGLFCANNAFAYVNYKVDGYQVTETISASEACSLFAAYRTNQGYGQTTMSGSTDVMCYIYTMQVVEYGKPAVPVEAKFPIVSACVINAPSTSNRQNNHPISMTATKASVMGGWPANYCQDKCTKTYSDAWTTDYAKSQDPATPEIGSSVYCTPTNAAIGATVTCFPNYTDTTQTCNMVSEPKPACPNPGTYRNAAGSCVAKPVCTSPAQYDDASNSCITPACPSGTTRLSATASCTPINCVPPMVRSNGVCMLPTCGTGETYEFKNGSGSCVKLDNPCPSPKALINNLCQNPVCAAGTSLNALGQCVATTAAPSTGTSGNSLPPTLTNTTTTTTNTSTGSTSTATTTTTGGGTGGTSTNPSGTCSTPPCGACDPSTQTCGTTFGGSCDTVFECNGDSIQCAVAKATNKSECLLKSLKVPEKDNPTLDKGMEVVNKKGQGLGAEDGFKNETIALSRIDQTNPYGSSCLPDQQIFEYKGQTYFFPLSKYCNIFQIMGRIMVTCALISAALLISKGNY